MFFLYRGLTNIKGFRVLPLGYRFFFRKGNAHASVVSWLVYAVYSPSMYCYMHMYETGCPVVLVHG